jgi:imidazoleglycerol phosphate synthase glutamine amidotransferase subunit HisH
LSPVSAVVLDYALARPRRLIAALAAANIDARLAETPLNAKTTDLLVVPDGDDADAALARGISSTVLDAIAAHIEAKKPLLCIGLGLHFLLEGRTHPQMPPGLGVFRAQVQRFDPRLTDEGERPLLSPHAGPSLVVGLDRHPFLNVLVPKGEHGVWMTFRHRLCAPSRIPQADVAVGHHGVPFAGVIWKENVLAVQFLPEHSGKNGIDLLRCWFSAHTTKTGIPR